jgi:DNA-directed RNA polymerase specialized sigma24 family protein
MKTAEHDDLAELLAAVPAATRACRRIVWSREDAEDCTATALEQALATRELDCPRAFLTTLAKRRALDLIKQREREHGRLRTHHARDRVAVPDETSLVDDKLEARWLWDEAQRLPQQTLAVLELIRDGHTIAETAHHLGLTKRSAESHLRRARLRLMPAWQATLGIGLIAWRPLRRMFVPPVVGTAALAGLAVLLLVAPGVGARSGSDVDVHRPHVHGTAQAVGRLAPAATAGDAAHVMQRQVRPRTAQRLPEPIARGRSIASVGTPAGPVTVQQEDRGGATDPVGGTLKCLSEFQVTPSHIGC